ncbi:MAG: urea transport system ATP-binding protein [Actinomycetota bacterium]|jgi:urea transport system ATP-binding protein|nr:urea transport system ATP-binding protein [Actinomycetota bacterium]
MNLNVEDVRVAYGRTEVIYGVSLDVPEGSLTCLMGRNGVGKSTLLNAVMGLLPLRSGRVCVDGEDIGRLSPPRRARAGMGYVPQGHQVFPYLSVLENLQVVVERERRADRSAIEEALDVFPALRGLLARPAGLLSGGQAQQLAIARALVSRPKLLILDEPTEGIQPSIILEIEDAIAALHQATGMTILLVEQYVEFALRLAQRYAVMEGGLITHAGDTSTVDVTTFGDLLAV